LTSKNSLLILSRIKRNILSKKGGYFMKKSRVLISIIAMLALTLTIMGFRCSSNTVALTILQTSDIHDHAGGYGSAASYSPLVTGNDTVLGGYARLASYISGVKNEQGAKNVLLCDSGDFTMGTVYTMTLPSTSPLSFMFFSMMQYDAITIGNHETDLGPNALYGFITSAQHNTSAPFTTPIIASNMDASASPAINTLVGNGTIVKAKIIVKNGIKIGLLGQMGPNADFDSPMAKPLTFDHNYADLKAQVDTLRANGAKLVVLLSHEGFTVDPVTGYAKGNDAELAKAVPGIDVILSGHLHINHTAVKASANCDTILVEPGEYGEYIARLDLEVDKDSGKIKNYASTNVPINDTIAGDPSMDYVVSTVVNPALNTALYPAFVGLFGGPPPPVDSILGTVAINNAPITTDSITTGLPVGESVLGNLAADSYRNAINGIWASAGGGTDGDNAMAATTGDPNRVQIAFVPGGVIRDAIAAEAGTISFADLYNVLPLGGDPLDSSALGYPLLTTYIKAADIYKIIGLSLSMGMDLSHAGASADGDYVINFAGIYVKILPTTSLTGLGYDIYFCPLDGNTSSPNYGMNNNIPTAAGTFINPGDGTVYKISVDLYTLMMMYAVAALHPGDPNYVINTYNADGSAALQTAVELKRVMTGATTTMRGWQAIVGWSWAASGHATSNLSVLPAAGGFGYTSSLPYRRVQ
jgi:2',3'-cyclic-nucleotide 2'-phosphodiesterase (5'-nucleotidase family)